MHRLETIHPCVKKMERVYVPNSDVKTRYRGLLSTTIKRSLCEIFL